MNKKAQIPTLLTVIIALVLSVVTLFVFATFNDNIGNQSQQLSKMLEDMQFSQSYIETQTKLISKITISDCQTCSPTQLKTNFQQEARERNFRTPYSGTFFTEIEKGNFQFTQTETRSKIEVQNIEIQTQSGANKIRRNFNLCMTFSQQGDFLANC